MINVDSRNQAGCYAFRCACFDLATMSYEETGRHRTVVQVRMADTDAYGHINNAAYATYAETARLDFWPVVGGNIGSFILAHQSIDFRAQVKFGEPVHVDTWVEKIGRTSITLRHQVVASNHTAADVRAVIVCFDYVAGAAAEVPESIRSRVREVSS
jgi:acyl-CoA thioester hydrolase